MNAIGFFCHADITPVDEEATFLLVISDIESRDWQLIIASDAIIKNGELASSLNCFHFSSPAFPKQNGINNKWCALQDLNGPGRPLLPRAAIHLACDLRIIDPPLCQLS